MGTNRQKNTVIEIGRISNIKYELPERFEESVSYGAYKKAFDITQEIIHDNGNYQKNQHQKAGGTMLRNTEQIYNIIFFTGNRGAGKTSAMLSYMEFLKDYYRDHSRGDKEVPLEMVFREEPLMFTGLEYIDASSLDTKETILGSVLAKMLKKWEIEEKRSYGNHGLWREEDYAYKKRQIQKRFNEVYIFLKNLRSKDDIMDEDSDMFMQTLENMSMTWNLKQAFQQLVADYLDIMEYPGSEGAIGSANHFLVISIDDLDLNIDAGFVLLDEVRKYLMIPNIIVLLSANYEQLEKVCANYYTSKFNGIKNEKETRGYITRLSREYLEKMVPVQRQVMLYSGEKWDFFDKEPITLRYVDGRRKGKEASGTLRAIIKKDMENFLGVKVSEKERVLYYLTPDTLRELISWVNQVDNLNEIGKAADPGAMAAQDREDQYSENKSWFWNEQFPWLIKKYLTIEEQELFMAMDGREPAEQVNFLKEKLIKGNQEELTSSLLQILGRLNQGSLGEQKLAYLIILYYTVKLSEILTSFQWEEKSRRTEKLKILMQYYNGGLWGAWERNLIKPLIKVSANEKTFARIGYTNFKMENGSLTIELSGTFIPGNWGSIRNFIDSNKIQLINYQYMLLFYRLDIENIPSTEHIWTIDDHNSLKLSKNYSGLFCLSNVILNWLEGAELVKRFMNELLKLLCPGGSVNKKNGGVVIRKKISIIDSKDTKDAKDLFLMPLGDVEYLIGLAKQIQDHMGGAETEVLDVDNKAIISKITVFFRIICKSLDKYDKEYGEKFGNFPPVKKILDGDRDFLEMLAHSITCHMNVDKADKDEEEWGI